MSSSAKDQLHSLESTVPTLSKQNTTMSLPPGLPSSRDQGWPNDGIADLHLSGSDPRMFPGIFSRSHRTNSLRNLAQGEESRGATDDLPPPAGTEERAQ